MILLPVERRKLSLKLKGLPYRRKDAEFRSKSALDEAHVDLVDEIRPISWGMKKCLLVGLLLKNIQVVFLGVWTRRNK